MAFKVFGDVSVPYVNELISSSDESSRFFALHLAADLGHPQSINPIANVLFDQAVKEAALLAIEAFRMRREIQPLRQSLVDGLSEGSDEDILIRVRALGHLHAAEAIEHLIALLKSKSADLKSASHFALVQIACVDFGIQPRKWNEWFKLRRQKHRAQWLIEALDQDDISLRQRAAEALRELSDQDYGFDAFGSERDRNLAKKRYQAWWQRQENPSNT